MRFNWFFSVIDSHFCLSLFCFNVIILRSTMWYLISCIWSKHKNKGKWFIMSAIKDNSDSKICIWMEKVLAKLIYAKDKASRNKLKWIILQFELKTRKLTKTAATTTTEKIRQRQQTVAKYTKKKPKKTIGLLRSIGAQHTWTNLIRVFS